MENKSSSKLFGDVRVPIGFRFLPTDVQLISCYLIPKILRHVLPADIIPPLDVFKFNPWDLPGDSREKRYFFCERGRKVNTYKLLTGSGYWKATGKQEVIWNNEQQTGGPTDQRRKAIGLKRKLTFCYARTSPPPHLVDKATGSTSAHRWVMWEYRLATSINTTANSNNKNVVEEVGDSMVCAITAEERKKSVNYNSRTRIQPCHNNGIEVENAGDRHVIDHRQHSLTRSKSCYNRYLHNDIVVTQKNYKTKLPPQESSTSSSCSTTLTSDNDFFSDDETTTTF